MGFRVSLCPLIQGFSHLKTSAGKVSPKHEAEPLWESLEYNNRLSYFYGYSVDILRLLDFLPPMESGVSFFTVLFLWKIISSEYFLHSWWKPLIYGTWMEEYKKLEKREIIGDRTVLLQSSCLLLLHLNQKKKTLPLILNPLCDFWMFICCMITDLDFLLLNEICVFPSLH